MASKSCSLNPSVKKVLWAGYLVNRSAYTEATMALETNFAISFKIRLYLDGGYFNVEEQVKDVLESVSKIRLEMK